MRILIYDSETTMFNLRKGLSPKLRKGSAFCKPNKLVMHQLKWLDQPAKVYRLDQTEEVKKEVERAQLVVGFNLKFDLHWLRRCGIDVQSLSIWECQLAEWLLNNQNIRGQNSLKDACNRRGLPTKLDVIEEEYWSQGINTDEIPWDVLAEYGINDVNITEELFKAQMELLKDKQGLYKLFRLHCQDLLVLQEMEWNGMLFDKEGALNEAKRLQSDSDRLLTSFHSLVGNDSVSISSGDHVSAILYGGVIEESFHVPVGHYKTGKRKGEVRYKVEKIEHTFERLVEPIKKTETAKNIAGTKETWIVKEDVLKSLKTKGKAKEIISIILEYRRIEKLRGTYLQGWGEMIDENHWEGNIIHGNLNQCAAVTGRLSSSAPNMQNADKITKSFLVSRYDSSS